MEEREGGEYTNRNCKGLISIFSAEMSESKPDHRSLELENEKRLELAL
jgi:hypothetical protein